MGKEILIKEDFGKLGFGENGILGKWDFEKINLGKGDLGKRGF